MTDGDVSDWRWVTIAAKQSGDAYVQPYDLPTLRNATTIKLAMPRVGFYTTPAFLALWNTNDSNQHRVTMNQTLLAALGAVVHQRQQPHAAQRGRAGLVAHDDHGRVLRLPQEPRPDADVLRQPVRLQRPERLREEPVQRLAAEPAADGAAAGGVRLRGRQLAEPLGRQHDGGPRAPSAAGDRPGFERPAAAAAVRHLGGAEPLLLGELERLPPPTTPVFRGIVADFVKQQLQLPGAGEGAVLLAAADRGGGDRRPTAADSSGNENVPVSIARQAHLCAALSNRMGISDVCALQAAVPTSAQNTTLTIAGSVANDAFSRGSPTPVTPAFPDLFYRAASEELCENIAKLVVDVTGGPYTSSSTSCTNGDGLLTKFVEQVMGVNPSDPAPRPGDQHPRDPLQPPQAKVKTTVAVRRRAPPPGPDELGAVDVRAGVRVPHLPRNRSLKERRQ